MMRSMKEEIIRCIKLSRYADKFRMNMILSLGMIILGCLVTMIDVMLGGEWDEYMLGFTGAMFTSIGFLCISSPVLQMTFGKCVLSSSAREFMHKKAYSVITFACGLASLLCVLVFGGIGLLVSHNVLALCVVIMECTICHIIMFPINSNIYKLPIWVMMVIFVAVELMVNTIINKGAELTTVMITGGSLIRTVLISVAVYFAIALFNRVLSGILYKKNMNKAWRSYIEKVNSMVG